MATRKLTKTAVDGLAPTDRAFIVYDSELKGFGLRVAPSGLKTWQVEYRPYPGGREVAKRRMALGASNTLTPDQARQKARDILSSVSKGGDPARDRNDKRREMKVADLIELYEREGCYVLRGARQGEPMKPVTKAFTIARLRHHVVPLVGTKRVTEVSSSDVERMVRDIGSGKTAKDVKPENARRVIVRGGDGAARKVARDLSAMFTFAVRRRIVPANPCEHAAIRKTDNRRTRYLSIEEVRRLGEALETLQAAGVNLKALDITRLWALTGCRRDEIAALKWSEIDFERGCLVLEDSKTGESVRPLATSALVMLDALPRYDHSPFVFPATSGEAHFQGTKKIWPKVIALAKLPGVTPHTLRHTLGSAAVSTGETLAMTGAILGHSNARSTAIYAHVQRDPAKKAAGRAVGPIAAALAGKPAAKVVPIIRRTDQEAAGTERPSDKPAKHHWFPNPSVPREGAAVAASLGRGPTSSVVQPKPKWTTGGLGAVFEARANERPAPEENRVMVEMSGTDSDRQLMAIAQKRGLWTGGDWRTRILRVLASEHPIRKPKSKGRKPAAKVGGLGASLGFVHANEDAARLVELIEALIEMRLANGQKRPSNKQIALELSEILRPSHATLENRISNARKASKKPARKGRPPSGGHKK